MLQLATTMAFTDANGKTTEEKVDETTMLNGYVKEENISNSARNGDLNGEAKKKPIESTEKEGGDVTLKDDKA